MFKERVKTSVIMLLFFNLIFLTCRMWFGDGLWQEEIYSALRSIPFAQGLLGEDELSIPMESLSKPRKILINDGSLWIAYYNTDVAFAPIESRTRRIIEGFLKGEAVDHKAVTVQEWQSALENVGIYIEYPIAYSTDMLCSVMGLDAKKAPKELSSIKDFIILPSTEETGVFVLVRDARAPKSAYIYQFGADQYRLPKEDLSIYTENNSDYYEPAFSTGVEPEGVSLDPMVLFFDSRPETAVLVPHNPLGSAESARGVLEMFFNNIGTAGSYNDVDGVKTYVENYADARIYPGGLFEYKAVEESKGVKIAESYSSYYETVNSAISFAEKLWSRAAAEPLSVLVSGDLTGSDANRIHLSMDYYQDGRPVAVGLAEGKARRLDHGIEIDICDGRIVSYRQFFRSFSTSGRSVLSGDFIGALDHFANTFAYREDTVISDIYIGYIDRGEDAPLRACWLAKVRGDEVIYSYAAKEGADEES